MTAARIIVRGATTAVTRRTTLRKSFLAPWHSLVDQCWLYSLADAQRNTGMAIHHGVKVITHHHLSITPSEPNTGRFLRLFHGDVSNSLNRLLAHERYDRPGDIFDKRSTHCMRLLDAEAQAAHLVYERLNPVAAGLVGRAEQMPGAVLDLDRWKSDGLVVRRPPIYFGKNRPSELLLRLTPPPLLYRTYGGDLSALLYALKRLQDMGRSALQHARGGRPPLGARELQHLHPWGEPIGEAEAPGQAVPTFKIGASGFSGSTRRQLARTEQRAWRHGYTNAMQAYEKRARQGLLNQDGYATSSEPVFPHGTYEMRLRHHVAVADPDPDALVASPGPLLHEVEAELARDPNLGDSPEQRKRCHELRDQVRDAIADEAELFAAGDLLEFGLAASAAGVRPPARRTVTHGGPFTRSGDEIDMPRRVVVLRDHRRRAGRSGADPPR